MSKRKSNKIVEIIAIVIVFLLVVLAGGFVFHFTNGFNESFKTFYLVCDGDDIVTAKSARAFAIDSTVEIKVKYTFDLANDEPRDYTVEIVPNPEADFDFIVDGQYMSWSGVDNLSTLFSLTKESTSFTLKTPSDRSIQSILSALYNGKTVEVHEGTDLESAYLYTIYVSSYNDSVAYQINFNISTRIQGIELDESGILFGGDFESGVNPPEETVEKYGIGYDTLGSGSVDSLKFNCVSDATAGETVRFAIEILDDELEVGNLIIESDEIDEYDYSTNSDGSYSFTMPASFVTVMIYLMPK